MLRLPATQLCLAWLLGLLASWALGLPVAPGPVLPIAVSAFALAGGLAAILLPRRWLVGPDGRMWVVLGLVAAVAVVYFQWRVPRPAATDVSQLIVGDRGSETAEIRGTVRNFPSLTTSNRVRFWLQADRANNDREVSGKLYVTVPLLQGTGIYPGQKLAVTGRLYKPRAPRNPGAFNFRDYLARQGSFAGFSAENVEILDAKPRAGWWQLRQRIVKAQVRGLGSPTGQLVASIALGRRAVDLPADIRELFIRAGLAHILAASGFHVSLLLGAIVATTRFFPANTRLSAGLIALAVYVGLTGISPSVTRAASMGAAALAAQQGDRRVDPRGALLLAATGLLLVNPLWVADLGFQLSFLATLGLLVTVPVVSGWLQGVPDGLAGMVAVPLAVLPWVLPLQLRVFGVFPPYSIAVNILTVPLVIVVSLGGMLSALVAAVYPPLGSLVASVLYYPAQALIAIVAWCDRLPGSSFAVGRIHLWQLVALYGAILLVWAWPRARRRWLLAVALSIALVVGPIARERLTSAEVTVLAGGRDPIVVLRDRNATLLINSGDAAAARYTVVPYLQQTGIFRLDAAVALTPRDRAQIGWSTVVDSVALAQLYQHPDLELPERFQAKALKEALGVAEELTITLAGDRPALLDVRLRDRQWLILDRLPKNATLPLPDDAEHSILVWSGQTLPENWLEAIEPELAIATGSFISPKTEMQLERANVPAYAVGRDGAVRWYRQGKTARVQVGGDRQFL